MSSRRPPAPTPHRDPAKPAAATSGRPLHEAPDEDLRTLLAAGAQDTSARAAPDRASRPREQAPPSFGTAEGMETVFQRYHMRRRQTQRRAAFFFTLLVGIGTWALLSQTRETPPKHAPVHTTDSEAALMCAASLRARVLEADGGEFDARRLQEDRTLRDEYLQALDHPVALVRRVALVYLTASEVEIPPATLLPMLRTFQEDLTIPLRVADVGDVRRHLVEALHQRRSKTLEAVLDAIRVQVQQGAMEMPLADILLLVRSHDAEVRKAALDALAEAPREVPVDALLPVLRSDPDPWAKALAARVLVRQGTPASEQIVFEQLELETDADAQFHMATALSRSPDLPAFARRQIAAGNQDLGLRMLWAARLAREGDPGPAEALVEPVLRSGDGRALLWLVTFAVAEDRQELRGRLLTALAALEPANAWPGHRLILRWDLDATDDALRMAGLALARELRPETNAISLRLLLSPYRNTGSAAFEAELESLLGSLLKRIEQDVDK